MTSPQAYTGIEHFVYNDKPVSQVIDFWRWQGSDLLNNSLRGILAEFIVATALNIESTTRVEWDLYDLTYRECKIEIKSSAYIQVWEQKKLYSPRFDIHKIVSLGKRTSDLYVFCLYNEKVKANVDPLNLHLWDFWTLSTSIIDSTFGEQKSVGLEMIKPIAIQSKYDGLKKAVDLTIESTPIRTEVSE